jgi:hypothetical protein
MTSRLTRIWHKHNVRPQRGTARLPGPGLRDEGCRCDWAYTQSASAYRVFCVDEKTSLQALNRRDRMLPLSPRRAERHGLEYVYQTGPVHTGNNDLGCSTTHTVLPALLTRAGSSSCRWGVRLGTGAGHEAT